MDSLWDLLFWLAFPVWLLTLYFPPLVILPLLVLWMVATLLGAWFHGSVLRPIWEPWVLALQGRRLVVLIDRPVPGGGSVALNLVSARRGARPELELQWTAADGVVRRFGTLIHEGSLVHLPRSERPTYVEVETAMPVEPIQERAFAPDEITLSIAAAGRTDEVARACEGLLVQLREAFAATSEPLTQRQRWLADRPARLVVWHADLPQLTGRRFRSASGVDYDVDCEGFLRYAVTAGSVSLPGVDWFDEHVRITGRLGSLEHAAGAYRLVVPDDQPTPLGARELLVADLLQARDASGRAFAAVYELVDAPRHRIGRNL